MKTVPIAAGRYLVLMDGVELELLKGGPYTTQKEFEAAVVTAVANHKLSEEADASLHILSVGKGGLEITDFSGAFMFEMRARAEVD